jgi:hypothetical protein
LALPALNSRQVLAEASVSQQGRDDETKIETAANRGSLASSSAMGDDKSTTIKQRRRKNNRALAQNSRLRKRYFLEILELRVEELERDKASLLRHLKDLKAQNGRLRGLGPDPARGLLGTIN